ncbi:carbohydrate ABC transporter permease [Embleya sp. AB8]|uniref:carbohydrate ABC transporter permease n=1 Tax=Embleya sp. AB8 TaxID=3156304 RepID=UPI003C709260
MSTAAISGAFVEVEAPARRVAQSAVPIPLPAAASASTDDRPVGSQSRGRTLVGHLVLAKLSVVCVFPVYWMYVVALREPGDALGQSLLPGPPSLANVRHVWESIPIARMLLNTFAVALATALGQTLISLFAAYAFAAWKFFGQRALFLLFVGSWLVPFQVTMIPNYVMLSNLGLLNTLAGIVVPTLCSAMAVLMLRQHLAAFPKELLDAARMDGRTSWGTLWTVVVPNLRPALASLFILLFISAWNEYFWPAMVLQRADSVVQVGIRGFMGAEGNNWGALMAASGLACLPIFAVYALLQRHVIDAFVRSGLK